MSSPRTAGWLLSGRGAAGGAAAAQLAPFARIPPWNQVMAASLVVSIPVVAAFLLLRRHFVSGLTAGAVK